MYDPRFHLSTDGQGELHSPKNKNTSHLAGRNPKGFTHLKQPLVFQVLLLVEEIRLTNWDVENIFTKNTANNGINFPPQLVQAGFPPSTALLVSGIGSGF